MMMLRLMKHRTALLIVANLVVFFGFVDSAEGQLFGKRTMGSPFQSRRSAGPAPAAAGAEPGTLQGNERFIRDNRSRNAFVGADRSSLQGFVGRSEAIGVGRVPAATESLTPPPDTSRRINRPLPPLSAKAMYYPRLEIDDLGASAESSTASSNLPVRDAELEQRLSRIADSSVQVRREGTIVLLDGLVESRAMAEKLVIIASFEPQVDQVRSALQVRSR